MQWCDPSDDSPAVISPDKEIAGFLHKRGPIPGFGVAERFLMIETKGALTGLRDRYPVREETFPLPAFLGKRPLHGIPGDPEITIVELVVGAPVAVDVLEIAIAMGCRKLFVFGLCGAVGEDVQIGDLVIPTRVFREEGTSYHYLPADIEVVPDAALLNDLCAFVQHRAQLPFHRGVTVSTDAVFRQTLNKELAWRQASVLGVDMEMSALLAVAQYHRIPAVGLLIVSDKHVLDPSAAWHWGGEELKKNKAVAIDMFVEFIRGRK